MFLRQTLDSARAEAIGSHGVSAAALNEALGASEAALGWLRAAHASGALPLLRLPERTDDLDAIGAAGLRLGTGATDIVVLGTGGSSLGGQTLAALADVGVRGAEAFRVGPRMHFVDNLGIDYPQRRGALIDAVTLADAKRVAKSLLDTGLLVTVVGKTQGLNKTN